METSQLFLLFLEYHLHHSNMSPYFIIFGFDTCPCSGILVALCYCFSFFCFLSQLINLVTKMEILLGVLF